MRRSIQRWNPRKSGAVETREERGRREGAATGAGVSERGDWPCMVEGGDVMAAGGEEDNVGLTTFLGAGL